MSPASTRVPLTRAIIAELPGLHAGLVRQALARGGIEVTAEVEDASDVAQAVASTQCELVIVPASRVRVASEYHGLLRAHPEVRLLTLSVADGSADLFEVRLIGPDVGITDMVAAIRSALASPKEDA